MRTPQHRQRFAPLLGWVLTVTFVSSAGGFGFGVTSPDSRVPWVHSLRFASGSYVPPPDYTIADDDDDEYMRSRSLGVAVNDDNYNRMPVTGTVRSPPSRRDVVETEASRNSRGPLCQKPVRERRQALSLSSEVDAGASWMVRNHRYTGGDVDDDQSKSFREDFRGTRVFVQNINPSTSWQDLKDHFRVAGEVIFASISLDQVTGEPKGHGVVQFETTQEAKNAIATMRDHPLDGNVLFVREDVQENVGNRQLQGNNGKGPTPPTKWKCANEENALSLSEADRRTVQQLIRARDQARRRRDYEESDAIRDELKSDFSIHIDDRLRMWWVADDNVVPVEVKEIKGEGRWGALKSPWRQIPTTPEFDACVDPDLVEGLLKQRDIARSEKDFATADTLLEEARNAPDGDLYLRIHDESRTWRIWTDEPPPRPDGRIAGRRRMSPQEECKAIVQKHAPAKIDEMRKVLEKFPGREYNVLKKLKDRYLK
jgi:RNA recognition motif. (a.k.a. RRM, RBD, or RNP domain)